MRGNKAYRATIPFKRAEAVASLICFRAIAVLPQKCAQRPEIPALAETQRFPLRIYEIHDDSQRLHKNVAEFKQLLFLAQLGEYPCEYV